MEIEKVKLLFATTNPAKVKKYQKGLQEKGVEVFTINDLNFKLTIEENGKDVLENALIKAKTYYDKTKMPTIGMDNALWIQGLPKEKQPGTHVRRIGGKELTDDEMITYYTSLVKQNGGKLEAKWIYGIVIYDDKGAKYYSWEKEHFFLIDKPSDKINPGYPLDSITIVPEMNQYLVELTEEEKIQYQKQDNTNEIVEMIAKHLKK